MLLRPVARLLLEKQITFPVLSELLKEVLIEVADERLAIGGRRQTDSRLSLLTGIHRKDVKRLRRNLAEERRVSQTVSLGALLVSRWMADSRYLDADGGPLPLPRQLDAADGPSFEGLVFSISKDIPARSILDEWIRLGVAEVDDADMVRLRAESFVPEQGFEEKLYFFGRNLRDHADAGVHNLLGEEPPFFDQSVFYDRLSPESVERLEQAARQAGADLLRHMNRLALDLQRQDAERPESASTHRMTVGAYFHAVDETNERIRAATRSEKPEESDRPTEGKRDD
jgi:hypothetical protein